MRSCVSWRTSREAGARRQPGVVVAFPPVSELPPVVIYSALGVGAIALGVGGWLALRAWRTARLISSTPPSAIAALTAGLHEVRGAIRGEGAVTAPLSERSCVYWRFLLEQRRQNRWETLVDRKAGVPAWLDDGGGRLELDVLTADVILTRSEHGSGGIFGVPSAELTRVLEALGEEPANLQGPYVRYREEWIVSGDRMHAVGTVSSDGELWRMRADGDVHVISDRDETEVVRYEERLALRWVGVVVIGAGLLGWGGLQLLG